MKAVFLAPSSLELGAEDLARKKALIENILLAWDSMALNIELKHIAIFLG